MGLYGKCVNCGNYGYEYFDNELYCETCYREKMAEIEPDLYK